MRVPFQLARAALAFSFAHLLGACAPLPISQQRLLAKPGMQFSDVRAYNEASRAASQLEPGRVVTGGAQASVCTTCR